MNEQDIKFQLVDEITALTDSSFSVRTDGGDEDVGDDLPVVVINLDSYRVRDHGHSTHAEYITDSNGNEIGERHVQTKRGDVDITIKSDSESERDLAANDIEGHFLLYEGNTDGFHVDCYKFEVGDIQPRKLQNVEPDWYQNGLTLEIKYRKYVDDESDDTLTTVNRNIDVHDDL